jgi:hypothetical protein
LPGREIAGAGGQHREVALEARQNLGRLEEPDPGRGQLDGKRQPIEPEADPHHRPGVVVRDREGGPHRTSSLRKECHRLELRESLKIDPCARVGEREWRNLELLLAVQMQRAAARDQRLHARCCRQEVVDDLGGRKEVLEIVEQEQHVSRLEVGLEQVHDGPFRLVAEA